jgi:hypothetical protein
MITRYGVWLDGQGLQDIDPTVAVVDIIENVPDMQLETVAKGVYAGSRVITNERLALSVEVRFMVREYDVMRRRSILQKVRDWAKDGWLTTTDHQDQQLKVICTGLPVVSSAQKWTDVLTVVFTAYGMPYWQEAYPVTVSGTGTKDTLTIRPMGTMPCRLEFTATTKGLSVSKIVVKVNDQKMQFEGLTVTADDPLVVAYTDEGYLTAKCGSAGVLGKRTDDSADDLWLEPNKDNKVTFEATTGLSISVTLKARGVWR